MKLVKIIFFLATYFVVFSDNNFFVSSHEVTHEDIKNAMLSLVLIMRENTDKLERHELRQRLTDEQIKKDMRIMVKKLSAIDKLNLSVEKLEGRINGIEQSIMQMQNISVDINDTSNSCTKAEKTTQTINDNVDKLSSTLIDFPQKVHKQWFLDSWSEVDKEIQEMKKEFKNLSKGQSIIVGIGDQILDLKKTIEFGNHILTSKVEEEMKSYNKHVSDLFTNKMVQVHTNITSNQKLISKNISSKMDEEMDQIWRQINILNQQIVDNTKIFMNITKSNGSRIDNIPLIITTMDNKVAEATKRMVDMSYNLNFLLEQLSLVTVQFEDVKKYIGNTLTTINVLLKKIQENDEAFNKLNDGKT